MFICIIGTIASGKSTVRDYIISKGFRLLTLCQESAYSDKLPITHDLGLEQLSGDTNKPSSNDAPSFADSQTMLDYVTRNWRSNFVTTSLTTLNEIEMFTKRPFVLLVNVDAPIFLRWKRHSQRESLDESNHEQLVRFLSRHDEIVYGHNTSGSGEGLASILAKLISVHITNNFDTLTEFYEYLERRNLLDEDRLRPRWETYFMALSELASQRSNCMKRRVGAVLVRNNRILSTGYNGTARGMTNCNEGGCSRCNGQARSGVALDECLCLHAEENALLEAGRERIGDGAVLYCNTCPCLRCSVKIVQTGVKVVVYNFAYSMDSASARVFQEAGVELRQHTPPHN